MIIFTFMIYPVFQLKAANRNEEFFEDCLEFFENFLEELLMSRGNKHDFDDSLDTKQAPQGIYHDVGTPELSGGNGSRTSVIWRLEATTASDIKARCLSSNIQA